MVNSSFARVQAARRTNTTRRTFLDGFEIDPSTGAMKQKEGGVGSKKGFGSASRNDSHANMIAPGGMIPGTEGASGGGGMATVPDTEAVSGEQEWIDLAAQISSAGLGLEELPSLGPQARFALQQHVAAPRDAQMRREREAADRGTAAYGQSVAVLAVVAQLAGHGLP